MNSQVFLQQSVSSAAGVSVQNVQSPVKASSIVNFETPLRVTSVLNTENSIKREIAKTPPSEVLAGDPQFSSGSSSSPPKLTREQGLSPRQPYLYGQDTYHEPVQSSGKKKSVFDFPDTESDSEMPVLESFAPVRRDRKLAYTSKGVPKIDSPGDSDIQELSKSGTDLNFDLDWEASFSEKCDAFLNDLQKNSEKLEKKRVANQKRVERRMKEAKLAAETGVPVQTLRKKRPQGDVSSGEEFKVPDSELSKTSESEESEKSDEEQNSESESEDDIPLSKRTKMNKPKAKNKLLKRSKKTMHSDVTPKQQKVKFRKTRSYAKAQVDDTDSESSTHSSSNQRKRARVSSSDESSSDSDKPATRNQKRKVNYKVMLESSTDDDDDTDSSIYRSTRKRRINYREESPDSDSLSSTSKFRRSTRSQASVDENQPSHVKSKHDSSMSSSDSSSKKIPKVTGDKKCKQVKKDQISAQKVNEETDRNKEKRKSVKAAAVKKETSPSEVELKKKSPRATRTKKPDSKTKNSIITRTKSKDAKTDDDEEKESLTKVEQQKEKKTKESKGKREKLSEDKVTVKKKGVKSSSVDNKVEGSNSSKTSLNLRRKLTPKKNEQPDEENQKNKKMSLKPVVTKPAVAGGIKTQKRRKSLEEVKEKTEKPSPKKEKLVDEGDSKSSRVRDRMKSGTKTEEKSDKLSTRKKDSSVVESSPRKRAKPVETQSLSVKKSCLSNSVHKALKKAEVTKPKAGDMMTRQKKKETENRPILGRRVSPAKTSSLQRTLSESDLTCHVPLVKSKSPKSILIRKNVAKIPDACSKAKHQKSVKDDSTLNKSVSDKKEALPRQTRSRLANEDGHKEPKIIVEKGIAKKQQNSKEEIVDPKSVVQPKNNSTETHKQRDQTKMESFEIGSPVKQDSFLPFPGRAGKWSKHPPKFSDGSQFTPGWKGDVWRFKQSLRMPPGLITVPKPEGESPEKRGLQKIPQPSLNEVGIKDQDDIPEAQPSTSGITGRLFKKLQCEIRNPSRTGSSTCGSLSAPKTPEKSSLKFDRLNFGSRSLDRCSDFALPVGNDSLSIASEDSDFDSLCPSTEGGSIHSEDLAIMKKTDIANKLVKKFRKRYSNKKYSAYWLLDKNLKVQRATNQLELLPTPGLADFGSSEENARDESIANYMGFFRKDTVKNYRENFNFEMRNGFRDYTPVVLRTRTRTQTKEYKETATIKEVFGEDIQEVRKSKAHVEDKKQKEEKKSPVSVKTNFESGKRQRRVTDKLILTSKKRLLKKQDQNQKLPISVPATTPPDHIDMQLDPTPLIPVRPKKLKYKILRRKFRSGFDYIRKKKKPQKKIEKEAPEESPVHKRLVNISQRRLDTDMDILLEEDIKDIQAEIRSWVIKKSIGETILHKAARLGCIDIVVYCLEILECKVSARDNAGYTPLHEACGRGHLAVAHQLLMYGADVNAPAKGGLRPIHEACENGFTELVRLLLSYGADPLVATYSGHTPVTLTGEDRNTNGLLKGFLADVEGLSAQMWNFRGSVAFLDPPNSGFYVCADVDQVEAVHDDTHDGFLFESSDAPVPQTYQLHGVKDKHMALDDFLGHIKKTRENLLKSHPQVEIQEVTLKEFLDNASCCDLLPLRVTSKDSKVVLLKLDHEIRQLQKLDSEKIKL